MMEKVRMKLRIFLLALMAPAVVVPPAFSQTAEKPANVLDPKVRGVIDPETEKKLGVPTGPAPRLKSGKPDMSGVWNQPYVPDMGKNGRGQQGARSEEHTSELQ